MKLEPQLGIAEAGRIGTWTAIGLDAGDNYDRPTEGPEVAVLPSRIPGGGAGEATNQEREAEARYFIGTRVGAYT